MNKFLRFFIIGLVIISAGCKDHENKEHLEVNNWVLETMETVYYWNKTMKVTADAGSTYPETFFETLLYKPTDRWSHITDDYEALANDLNGTPESMGFEGIPAILKGTNDNIGIFITHVYENTPAYQAGLERGDIITKVNGVTLNRDNYSIVYNGTSYTATLEDGTSLSMVAQLIDADPVIHKSVFNIENETIGYLAYMSFVVGDNEKFLQSLTDAFAYFEEQLVTSLIVDFRYNRGGDVRAAEHFASLLAPKAVMLSKSLLIENEYNEELGDYLQSEAPERLKSHMKIVSHNLDLNKVYFIISDRSASASEVVVSGLEPYMEVTTIGTTSVGKYAGMLVLHDTHTPPKHNWGMMPITFVYKNSVGATVEGGIVPDHQVEEDFRNMKPLGSLDDPMLSMAVDAVLGNLARIGQQPFHASDIKKLDYYPVNSGLYYQE